MNLSEVKFSFTLSMQTVRVHSHDFKLVMVNFFSRNDFWTIFVGAGIRFPCISCMSCASETFSLGDVKSTLHYASMRSTYMFQLLLYTVSSHQ